MRPSVLIVDDSPTIRMDLDAAFAAGGFDTCLCATAEAARAAVAAGGFAAAVLDVVLPDGDGIELLRALRAGPATAAIPIVLLSTEAEVGDRLEGLRVGATDYFGKPYDRERLVARVRAEVDRAFPDVFAKSPTRPILIVDDSPTARETLAAALRARGWATATAADGAEGLELARRVEPIVAVVDGAMPRLDGRGFIRGVRQDPALRELRCVLLTGSDEDERDALDTGADGYLRKAEGLDVIVERVAAIVRAEQDAATPASGGRGSRILVIDDSRTWRAELAERARAAGYDVATSDGADEALELLAAQAVDCIVLDRHLPGASGEEICGRLKASPAWRSIPVVMVSEDADEAAIIASLRCGADDFVPKAAAPASLLPRIAAHLRRKALDDQHRLVRDALVRRELDARDARAARDLADERARTLRELERKYEELEAFSFSASHDLQGPLRAISGFAQILVEEHRRELGDDALDCARRIHAASQRMRDLIAALLGLARVSRAEARREPVDLSALAREVVAALRDAEPERRVEVTVAPGLRARGDPGLLRVALENLIGNAWKYTARAASPRIEVDAEGAGDERAFVVRDNGVGFDPALAGHLFKAFKRLHPHDQFPGTGIGLTTVKRIIERHGGTIEAVGVPGGGATFRFTLPTRAPSDPAADRRPSPAAR